MSILEIRPVDENAHAVGLLAQRLLQGYYTNIAALHVASSPEAAMLAPPIELGQIVPILRILREDGTHHAIHFHHFLARVREPEQNEDFKRAWLSSSLLRIGDALREHSYFDHAPEAELVRHLRNGIAHNNKFRFDRNVIDNTSGKLRYPAHNKRYHKLLGIDLYEIDTHLAGSCVLFQYGCPAAILDVIASLAHHLTRTEEIVNTPSPAPARTETL